MAVAHAQFPVVLSREWYSRTYEVCPPLLDNYRCHVRQFLRLPMTATRVKAPLQ